jgi:Phosphate transport regulator (distant homolog of PhoU)
MDEPTKTEESGVKTEDASVSGSAGDKETSATQKETSVTPSAKEASATSPAPSKGSAVKTSKSNPAVKGGGQGITLKVQKILQKPSLFQRFFEHRTEFFDMLIEQSRTTLQGMEALETWITTGAAGRCQLVRDLEHKADDQKFALEKHLAETLITPLDREDIYDLSANLDEVINAAKQTAREIEAFGTRRDDPALAEMANTLVVGSRHLLQAFESLNGDLKEASKHAALARKADSKCEKVYRRAMKELFDLDDTKTIMRTVEVYKTLMAGGNRIDTVGEKLLHVIIKIG